MGIVSQLFGKSDEKLREHREQCEHCVVDEPDNFYLSDENRADMLYVVNEARKLDIIDAEDEMELEIAIGSAADDDHYGWPATTTLAQKTAIIPLMGALVTLVANGGGKLDVTEDGLQADRGGSVFDGFGDFVNQKLRGQPPDGIVGMSLLSVPVGDDGKIKEKDLQEMVGRMKKQLAREGRIEAPPADDDDASKWLQRGYL